MTIIQGWLNNSAYSEDKCLHVLGDDGNNEPLVELMESFTGKQITLRYFICDMKATLDEAQRDFVEQLAGKVSASLYARYSDITGFLWLEENLVIGGHDLLDRLSSGIGKYLILEVNKGAFR